MLDAPPPIRKRTSEAAVEFLKTMLIGSPEEALAARVARAGVAGLALKDVPGEMNIRRAEAEKLAAQLRCRTARAC